MTGASPLTCLEMVARLDDYIDRNLAPEELGRVEAHLTGCLECADEFRFEASLLEGIRERARRIALPPSLLARIHASLARERGDRRARDAS